MFAIIGDNDAPSPGPCALLANMAFNEPHERQDTVSPFATRDRQTVMFMTNGNDKSGELLGPERRAAGAQSKSWP